jgi:hypothetical protein
MSTLFREYRLLAAAEQTSCSASSPIQTGS